MLGQKGVTIKFHVLSHRSKNPIELVNKLLLVSLPSPFAFGADLSAVFAGAAPALAGAAAVFAGAATFTGAGSSLSESRHANIF